MILEKGSLTGIIGGVIAVGILIVVLVVSGGNTSEDNSAIEVSQGSEMTADGVMMKVEESELPVNDEMITEDDVAVYAGDILAGNGSATLLDFNQADYEQALAEDVPVFLYFYAKWCPSCRAEVPKMQAAFNNESAPAIIGFRVNYKDKDTDDYEEALAREFGIGYQHTKVALINGERVLKSPEQWDTDRYLAEFNNLAQ
jgi:thiol-disulfide isomerase/thioredoxin